MAGSRLRGAIVAVWGGGGDGSSGGRGAPRSVLGGAISAACAIATACGGGGPAGTTTHPPGPDAAQGVVAPDDAGATCPPGTWRDAGGGCVPAGVPTCAAGFVSDGDRGCTAVLPATPCPDGEVAWIGETACHEVVGCGDGTWGDVPTEADSVYVDGAYAGGDSDGSPGKPWRSVQDGIDHCPAGAIVAVAAGDYDEGVAIKERPVRLWGRCPRLVTISGSALDIDYNQAPRTLDVSADGTEIHALRIAPRRTVIALSTSAVTVLDQVAVSSTFEAVSCTGGMHIARSVFDGSIEIGDGPEAQTSTIRSSLLRSSSFVDQLSVARGATAWLVDTRVEGGQNGIAVDGEVVLARSSIRDVGAYGMRISSRGRADVVDTEILRSGASAVQADYSLSSDGASVSLRSTTIRGAPSGGFFAHGTFQLDAEEVRIADVSGFGIFLDSGATAYLRGVAVSNVAPNAIGEGYGVSAYSLRSTEDVAPPSTRMVVEGSVVERTTGAGIVVLDAYADLRGTVVRDVARRADGTLGDGISVIHNVGDASLLFVDGEIASAPRAGISSFGAPVSVRGARFVDDAIDLDVESSRGVDGVFDDGGGNVCTSGGASRACAALTTRIAPPAAPEGP